MMNPPLLLAQTDPIDQPAPPPVLPDAPPAPGTPAPGAPGSAGTPTSPGGPNSGTPATPPQDPTGIGSMFWILILGIVVMMVITSFSQRRERKKRQAILAAVKKGDRVQTIGGIIGSVVDVRDQEVVVKVDENSNTRMRFARSAIQNVLEDKSE